MKSLAVLTSSVLFAAACASHPARPSPCSYGLFPGTLAVGLQGGSRTVTVTTTAGCAWAATSAASWVTLAGSDSGVGPGSVQLVVQPNAGAATRDGVVSVAGASLAISQTGSAACAYTVTPLLLTPCMSSPPFTIGITAAEGCPWTAASDVDWLVLDSGSAGSGSGTVGAHTASNYSAPREAVIRVRWPTPSEGQNVRVAQAGCLYSVSTAALSVPAGGGEAGFDVLQMAQPNECGGPLQDRCVWTARPDATWITIASSPGSGDGRVTLRIGSNESAVARSGTVTVADKIVRVIQSGR